MTNQIIFIKPLVTDSDDILQQQKDFKTFIKPAIKQAGLSLPDRDEEGVLTKDISRDLIRRVYDASLILVDVNCYAASGFPSLSPILAYYLAMCHAMADKRTIMIARGLEHLPYGLKQHVLTYSGNEIVEFYEKFERAIQVIQAGGDRDPDNPIQEYCQAKAKDEQLKQARQEVAEVRAAQEALKQQVAEGKATSSRITFRSVGK